MSGIVLQYALLGRDFPGQETSHQIGANVAEWANELYGICSKHIMADFVSSHQSILNDDFIYNLNCKFLMQHDPEPVHMIALFLFYLAKRLAVKCEGHAVGFYGELFDEDDILSGIRQNGSTTEIWKLKYLLNHRFLKRMLRHMVS